MTPEITIKRNRVVLRWGTPDATVGSVNEPREMTEHGVVFNEKWTYRDLRGEPSHPRQRTVYWHRYDFVASFIVDAEGRLVREDPSVFLAGLDERLYLPHRDDPPPLR